MGLVGMQHAQNGPVAMPDQVEETSQKLVD